MYKLKIILISTVDGKNRLYKEVYNYIISTNK